MITWILFYLVDGSFSDACTSFPATCTEMNTECQSGTCVCIAGTTRVNNTCGKYILLMNLNMKTFA